MLSFTLTPWRSCELWRWQLCAIRMAQSHNHFMSHRDLSRIHICFVISFADSIIARFVHCLLLLFIVSLEEILCCGISFLCKFRISVFAAQHTAHSTNMTTTTLTTTTKPDCLFLPIEKIKHASSLGNAHGITMNIFPIRSCTSLTDQCRILCSPFMYRRRQCHRNLLWYAPQWHSCDVCLANINISLGKTQA